MSNPRIDYSLIKERIIDILGEKIGREIKKKNEITPNL
jgi:hypothetical protein